MSRIVCWWCEGNPCDCVYSPAAEEGERGYICPTINVRVRPGEDGLRWDFDYGDFCALTVQRDALRRNLLAQQEHFRRMEYDPEYALRYWERAQEKAKSENAERHIRWCKDLLWLRRTAEKWPRDRFTVSSRPRVVSQAGEGEGLFNEEDFR